MSKILIVTKGLKGMTYASGDMAHRLSEAGHEIHYACPEPVGDLVRHQVTAYHQLTPPDLEPWMGDQQTSKFGKLMGGIMGFSSRRRRAIEGLQQVEFRDLLSAVDPHLVMIDLELHPYIFTIHASSYNYLLISQWFQTAALPGVPHAETTLLPDDAERIAKTRRDWRNRQKKRMRKAAIRMMGNDKFSVYKAYAAAMKFPGRYLSPEGWPPPYTYRDLPTIHFALEEMDFPYRVPDTTKYVGPMVSALSQDDALGQAAGDVLRRARSSGKRVIYAVGSTMRGQSQRITERLIRAVSDEADWELVLSLAGQPKPADWVVPANVHVFDWISQRALLPEVDCCITHGGINTINECIFFGVPMVIYCGDRHDQPGCTARMAYHGLAVVGSAEDSETGIRDTIREALTSADLHARIAALRHTMHDNRTRQRVTEIVAEQIDRGRRI